jgi:DNA-binding beta-propeller fold protein YncE
MAWLYLGAIALPLAALAYFAAQRLGPYVLEEALETPAEVRAPDIRTRRRLSNSQLMALRGAAAVAILALIAFGVSRWPAARPGAPAVAPAVPVQLPPPIALKAQARFGSDGGGQGQLHDPRDLAVDPGGSVYVADTGNKRIAKFRPDGSFVSAWTTAAQGQLVEPSALAIVPEGIVVDDSEAGQLHKYIFDGQPVAGFEHELALSHPRGIAIAPDGTILVADTANNRIVRVGPDGGLRGTFDTRDAKLEQPTSLAVDDQGSVYSIEPAASRIQKFAPDGSLQAHLYLPPTVTLYPPRGAFVPARGLTVTVPDQNLLVSYGPAGQPQATFVAEGASTARPIGVASSPDRQSLWVLWNLSANAAQLIWP